MEYRNERLKLLGVLLAVVNRISISLCQGSPCKHRLVRGRESMFEVRTLYAKNIWNEGLLPWRKSITGWQRRLWPKWFTGWKPHAGCRYYQQFLRLRGWNRHPAGCRATRPSPPAPRIGCEPQDHPRRSRENARTAQSATAHDSTPLKQRSAGIMGPWA